MLNKILIVGIIMIAMLSFTGCTSAENENRDYKPKGDLKIKEDMNDEELMSYNMGMEDTKEFLKLNNNKMTNINVYENLINRFNDKTTNITLQPNAYFKGAAYYLVIVDSEGNEYKDLECAEYLYSNYKAFLENMMKDNEISNKENSKRKVSDNEIEKYFKNAIEKIYTDMSEDIELAFYDEPKDNIVKADIIYDNEILNTMYLNLYTGKVTYKEKNGQCYDCGEYYPISNMTFNGRSYHCGCAETLIICEYCGEEGHTEDECVGKAYDEELHDSWVCDICGKENTGQVLCECEQ